MERLNEASEDDLRAILQALCTKAENRTLALDHLDWLEKGRTNGWTASLKRQASDPVETTCKNCNKIFTSATNGPFACSAHTGKLEVVDLGNTKEWTCCFQDACSEICTIRKAHLPMAVSTKKMKLEASSAASSN